jgi:hypothetical protein
MRSATKLVVGAVALAMIAAPAAYSQSTRGVHDTYYDTFTPETADVNATEREATVNCGDPGVPGQSTNDNAVSSHDGQNELSGADKNTELPCWSTTDHKLWTESTPQGEEVRAASPPFYQCTAEGVDLDVSLQNPFPVQVPDPALGDRPAEGEDGYDDWTRDHGVIVTSGSFYVIPEIAGDDASEVDAVWFSFLETAPTLPGVAGGGSDETCLDASDRAAVSAGGAYYEFYRGDIDKSDGWTIPVNTLLVPDNVYGAKLTFLSHPDEAPVEQDTFGQPYPGGAEVLAQSYVYAIVDNDADDTGFSPCEPTREACNNQDTTPPWPQVTPGDVPVSEVPEDSENELTVTFGEHVQVERTTVNVTRPGEDSPALNNPGSPPHDESDVDSYPLVTLDTDKWGEKLEYKLEDPLTPCTEISVNTFDLHGNEATKTTTAGDCDPSSPDA